MSATTIDNKEYASVRPIDLVRPPIRIGLLGQVGVGNFGNDGSLEAILAFLLRVRPDADLTIICPDPEVADLFREWKMLRMTRPQIRTSWLRALNNAAGRIPYKLWGLVRVLNEMRRFDVLIVPGTGALDDFSATPFGLPYVHFKWSLAARLRRRKLGFVSVGAGPIHHALSRIFLVAAARFGTFRTFRDENARDFMSSLGLDVTNDRVFPDLAFGLPIPPRQPRTPDVPMIVGVGVMRYLGRQDDSMAIYRGYMEKMARFTHYLLERGFVVRLMIGQDNDEMAVTDIRQYLAAQADSQHQGRLLYEPARSLKDVMTQMLGTDLVVASRFHNVVCALRVGKPAISLGYGAKHDVLMADMGLKDYAHHIERFTFEWLVERFETLLAKQKHHAQRIQMRVEDYGSQLAAQEKLIESALL